MSIENLEHIQNVLSGKTQSVTVTHDHRNRRYILKRRGFRDVVISEKAYNALMSAAAEKKTEE
jgi:hypothetical protein